jgi:hypothetical protein
VCALLRLRRVRSSQLKNFLTHLTLLCATSCPVFGRSGPCSFAPGTRFIKCGLLGALPRGRPRVLVIASTRPRTRPGSLLSGFSTDCIWRIKLHPFLLSSSYMFHMFRVRNSFESFLRGGFAIEKRNTLRCLVSFLLELRFAPVPSFTIATAESVRLTNFHIHLVRGDGKSFSCISSSALLVHSVFPTVLLLSASEKGSVAPCLLPCLFLLCSPRYSVIRLVDHASIPSFAPWLWLKSSSLASSFPHPPTLI